MSSSGDFAAEGNAKKEMAQHDQMVRVIDTNFPSATCVPDGITKWIASPAIGKREAGAPCAEEVYNRGNSLGDGPFPQSPTVS